MEGESLPWVHFGFKPLFPRWMKFNETQKQKQKKVALKTNKSEEAKQFNIESLLR